MEIPYLLRLQQETWNSSLVPLCERTQSNVDAALDWQSELGNYVIVITTFSNGHAPLHKLRTQKRLS